MIDVTLSTQADLVKTVVIHILIEGGYALDRKDHENLTTCHRGKISGLQDCLLRRRPGIG